MSRARGELRRRVGVRVEIEDASPARGQLLLHRACHAPDTGLRHPGQSRHVARPRLDSPARHEPGRHAAVGRRDGAKQGGSLSGGGDGLLQDGLAGRLRLDGVEEPQQHGAVLGGGQRCGEPRRFDRLGAGAQSGDDGVGVGARHEERPRGRGVKASAERLPRHGVHDLGRRGGARRPEAALAALNDDRARGRVERVGREPGRVGAAGSLNGGPVHRSPGHVEPGGAREDGLPVGLPLPQRRDHREFFVLEGLHDRGGESRGRPDLHEGRESEVAGRPDARLELDGPPQVLTPVLRCDRSEPRERRAGDVGHQRQGGRPRLQGASRRDEFAHQRGDQRGVGSGGDREHLGADAALGEQGAHGGHPVGGARDGDRARAVARGDRDAPEAFQDGQDLVQGRTDGTHPAADDAVEQAPAQGHERQRALQREHPRHRGGAQFADAVPQHQVGRIPQLSSSLVSAYSTAKRPGCAYVIECTSGASAGSSGHSTS